MPAEIDPNRHALYRVAYALGELREEVVFVGGAVAGLLITDTAAAGLRPTFDVDVVVEVASHADYHETLAPRLRAKGFTEDDGTHGTAPVMCRWFRGDLCLDVMPTSPAILGFSNRWYPQVVKHAQRTTVEALEIRVVSAPLFLATKFEAFASRGRNDYYASHDLEDIIAVVDGRPEITEEVALTDHAVRHAVSVQAAGLLARTDARDIVQGHLVDHQRAPTVLQRMHQLRSLG